MNILITGANGYIAKNLIKKISNNTKHNLTLLVREDSNIDDLLKYVDIENIIFYDGSIKSMRNLANYKIDLVFHLANYYPDSIRPNIPEEIISSNLTLIANVVTVLQDNTNSDIKNRNFRIINVTSYVISDRDENSLYKHTKKSAFNYLRNQNCQNYILYDTYGENDPRPKLINYLINYSNTGEKFNMKYSEDSQINLVYIKDVIDAFILAIDKNQKNDIFEIRCETLTLKEVVNTFNQISEKQVNVIWPKKNLKNTIKINIYNSPKNWKAKYSLITGLIEMFKNEI